MPNDEKILQMARNAIAHEAWRLEDERKNLKLREHRHVISVIELRKICPHARAVEIGRSWADGPMGNQVLRDFRHRVCLDCGAHEEGLAQRIVGGTESSWRYIFLNASTIVHREVYVLEESYEHLLYVYLERLHKLARFDEFDDVGNWTGNNDPHIVRGED